MECQGANLPINYFLSISHFKRNPIHWRKIPQTLHSFSKPFLTKFPVIVVVPVITSSLVTVISLTKIFAVFSAA